MAKKKITLKSVKDMKPGDTIWDSELRGFGVRYRQEGRFFMLKYSINGRQRFYTIGEWNGDLTPEKARGEAEKLRGKIRDGVDPMTQKASDRKIPVVKNAFPEFLSEIAAKRSKRTHAEYKRAYEKFILKQIGNYRIDAIARPDIAKLHHSSSDTPYQANRILALLSSFFSWCEKNGYRADGINPCRHVEKFKESSRERFLSENEIYRLGQALKEFEEENKYVREHPHKKKKGAKQEDRITSYITAAIRLLLLTGARCNEILTLKWADVDFERRLIRLQESKTGQKTIYLSAPALQMLAEMPRIQGNPYVICGKKEGSHLVNIKDPWGQIRQKAQLNDVRIHDLRHNYASTAVVSGHHLKVIGSLLGHADTKTTERYAHLANDPLQTANEAISNRILNAMTTKPEQSNIVGLRKGRQ